MVFRNQIKLYMEWFDSRVIYYNLHQSQGLNTLVQDQKQIIWTPSLIFDNTDQKVRTKTDEESVISIKKEGKFTRNTINDVDNIYMDDVSESNLKLIGSQLKSKHNNTNGWSKAAISNTINSVTEGLLGPKIEIKEEEFKEEYADLMEPKIETKDKEIKKESFSGPASYPISSWVSGGEAGSGFQPRDLTLSSIQNSQ